jgi:hypothetical protein
MMDDRNPLTPTVPAPEKAADDSTPENHASGAAPAVTLSPAVERFKSCRWKATEGGEFCTHRDVLPFAGKEGFVADSWCPDCQFYKLRRTPKKRERVDYTY